MSKPRISTLKNGLTVITQHVPGEQVYSNVTVDVGYRHERPDQDNVAHFLEHMAASETEDLNVAERSHYVSSRRGTSNASTSLERTDYHIQVGKEYAEDAIKLLADGFIRPKFDDKHVDVERKAVEAELRNRMDEPSFINYQRIHQTAFPDTQFDKDRFETVHTIQGHTTEVLKDFKDVHYTADNMVLAVVGDITHEEVLAYAEQHFDGLPETPSPEKPRHAPPAAVYRGGMKVYDRPDAAQVQASIAFEGSGRKNPRTEAIDTLLSQIMGAGRGSRLHQALVEKGGLARDAGSYTIDYPDNGLFVMNFITSSDNAKAATDAVAQETLRLSSTLTQAELDEARNRIVGHVERSIESIENIGANLAVTKAVDGKLYDVEQELALYNGITLEQLQQRASELFTSPPAVSFHGNESEKFPDYGAITRAFGQERTLDERGLVVQSEQEKAAAIARATAPGQEAEVTPAPVTPQTTTPSTEVTTNAEVTVLENGLRIVTQKMPTKQISAELTVGVGSRHETPAQTGIATLIGAAASAASDRLGVEEKAQAIANLRGKVSSGVGRETTSFSLRAANEFTPDALQLLAEHVTAPRLDAESIKKQQTLLTKRLEGSKNEPRSNTEAQLYRVAFPGSQLDKDYVRDIEKVGTHTPDAIRQFKDQHYTADNTTLTVVGDVKHEDIVKLAREQFSGLKAQPDTPRPAMPEAKYRGGMEVQNNEQTDQVTLRLGFAGSGQQDSRTLKVDALLGRILGGGFSSRLMANLRSDKGFVYHVSSSNSALQDAGLFSIFTWTKQENLTPAIDAIAEEVTKFAATVTQDELDNVKSSLLGGYERMMSDPESVTSTRSTRAALTGNVADFTQDIAEIKSVTLEDIKARAQEIFSSPLSVAAYGKGADKIPSYEDITAKFGQPRTLDASGLAAEGAPPAGRNLQGAVVAAAPQRTQQHAMG